MYKINVISFCLLIVLSGCKRADNKQNEMNPVEVISVDIEKATETFDATSIIDTTYYEFIPLETSDECLIAYPDKVYYEDNKIFVYDKLVTTMYIFNRDGSYHAKVHAVGQGPGEYTPDIEGMAVTKSHIAVLNSSRNRILLYNFDGRHVKNISLLGGMGISFFSLDEVSYCLINNWSITDKGYYNFYRVDSKKNKIEYSLPFTKEDYRNGRGWVVHDFYSLYNDHALFALTSINTIYEVNAKHEVRPAYYVDFKTHGIPKYLLEGNGSHAVDEIHKNNYVLGINEIKESEKYLFLDVDHRYITIYDKNNKSVNIANYALVDGWGNFTIHFKRLARIKQDTLINIHPYNPFLECVLKDYDIKDGNFLERFSEIFYNHINEDNNPFVALHKLK
jgi:uncharacterized protein YkuJ